MCNNDNYIDDLTQIKKRQTAVLDEIDRIREREGGVVPNEIDKIREDALAILDEIDEITGRITRELSERAEIERRTILYRMKMTEPNRRERIGSIWV